MPPPDAASTVSGANSLSSPASLAESSASSAAENRLGILCMVTGMALFTLNDAMGKWLVETCPVPLILAVRSASALLILAPLVMRAGFSSVFGVPDPGRHLIRNVLIVAEVAFFYLAVREMPLADVMTIYMAAPLLVTALSVPLLGEKVGLRRWIAVGVGFVGVVLVLRPGGDFLSSGTPIALAGSLTFALTLISTRSLRGASGLTLITTQTLGVGLAGTVALPFVWVTPTLLELSLIGVLGVVALIAHVLVNHSLKLSPAAVVAPYQYTSLVWAMALGWAFWGDIPELPVASGAALIIGSGLFVFYREQQLAKAVA
jgi:drug/metabolite transporter (DMT)-like permease